ncbi:MAG: endonuclease/exonuclease/phosphatase family protein [Chlamydiota bacterium]
MVIFSFSVIALAIIIFYLTRPPHGITNSVKNYLTKEALANLSEDKFSAAQWEELRSLLDLYDAKLRIVSYNMLFSTVDQVLPRYHHWQKRLPMIAELIEHWKPDILCCQELYYDQLKDLDSYLNDYAFYGPATLDGKESGECNAIFYRTERLELLAKKPLFFSNTPDVPSPDPFGQSHSLAYCKFHDKKTLKTFSVLNTHLSFYSPDSREYEMRFLVKITKELGSQPLILGGDFNTFPFRQDLAKLPFCDGNYCHSILANSSLQESMSVAKFGHVGPLATFTNSEKQPAAGGFKGYGVPGVILDYFYVSPHVVVLRHAVEPAKVSGNFPSDHMPLIIDVLIDPMAD